MINIKNVIILIVALCIFNSCKPSYSFTGASIPEDVKTVSVEIFQNFAPLANVNLTQTLTEELKDKFISQTNLDLVVSEGDLHFEGAITDYKITPVAIQGDQTAAINRLTITVKVTFENQKDEKQNFESSFTRYADFDSSKNLSDVEDLLIRDINDQLTQDIFNKAVSNW